MAARPVAFTALAALELDEALAWYEEQLPGLGERLRQEVALAVDRVARLPTAWAIEADPVRKFVLNRFPYKLLYAIEADRIVVLAFAHQHRRPGYWVGREGSAPGA